jgi:GNAT superfamily N-acetyltransferase
VTAGFTRREERVVEAAYGEISVRHNLGYAVVLLTPEAPGSPMLNRIIGLGSVHPVTEDELDQALAVPPPGTTFYVAIAPHAEPSSLPTWLADRGLEPGWGWMGFRRGLAVPAGIPTTLTVSATSGDADEAAFARIVRLGYGLPKEAEAAIHRAFTSRWECLLARDGDRPVAAAALYAMDGVAYLGFAATAAEHRGRGGQSALLATRIRRAAEFGCDVVITETGELRKGSRSDSYRNLVRFGFEKTAVTANWLGRHA